MTEHGPDARQPREKSKKPRGSKPPSQRGRTGRASMVEVELRVGLVLSLIVQGVCRRRQILQTLAKLYGEGKIDWSVKKAGEEPDPLGKAISSRTVDLYIQRATDELARIADEPRAVAKGKARGRYELALAGAASAKQWDVVRKTNRDIARLDGLEPGIRVNHGGVIETAHTGAIDHTHTVAVKNGSIDDRANRITDILGIAQQRRAAQLAAAQGEAANN